MLREGVGLSTDTDSELIGQIIAKTIAQNMKCREGSPLAYGDISRELSATMSALSLSYSLLVMTYDRIYALRDPYGNRPLCVARMRSSPSGGDADTFGYVAASESCAFPPNSEFLFEVAPGEMIEIGERGVKSIWQVGSVTVLGFMANVFFADDAKAVSILYIRICVFCAWRLAHRRPTSARGSCRMRSNIGG